MGSGLWSLTNPDAKTFKCLAHPCNKDSLEVAFYCADILPRFVSLGWVLTATLEICEMSLLKYLRTYWEGVGLLQKTHYPTHGTAWAGSCPSSVKNQGWTFPWGFFPLQVLAIFIQGGGACPTHKLNNEFCIQLKGSTEGKKTSLHLLQSPPAYTFLLMGVLSAHFA